MGHRVNRLQPLKLREMSDSAVSMWFDPGETTGWSIMQVHPEALADPTIKILENIESWSHGQIDCGATRGNAGVSAAEASEDEFGNGVSISGEAAGVHECLELVDVWPGTMVGIEDFVVRRYDQSRAFLSPVRVTAGIDYGLYLRFMSSFRQQPSEAKTTVTDARLKAWNFYRSEGSQVHARDADRHNLTFLRKCKSGEKGRALRAQAWPHLFGEIVVGGQVVQGPYYQPPRRPSRAS